MGYFETFKNKVGSYDEYGEYIIDLIQFVYTHLYVLSEGVGVERAPTTTITTRRVHTAVETTTQTANV